MTDSTEQTELEATNAVGDRAEVALLYAGLCRKTEYYRPEYCNKCGEKSNVINIKDTDSGVMSEAETVCGECGHEDYWAHGYFESGAEMIGKAKRYTRI